jgi:acyl-CoA synthetase (AMP-forming)/AMP-acid ligase II
LAETTLIVTGGSGPKYFPVNASALANDQVVHLEADDPDTRTLIGCGHNLPEVQNTVVEIVNPQTLRRSAPGQLGEIWVGGGLIAKGYWNRPEETAETFGARIADTGEGPFLRTGDRGFIKDGELVFAGRIKDLIIIEGRNHYPQDLEMSAEDSHRSLRAGCCAAFSIDTELGERAVLVAEVNRNSKTGIDVAEIGRAVRRRISEEHGIRLHDLVLIQPGTIPKTSSGKLQRAACRARYLANELETITPSPVAEGQVACV